jgi:uncharacterized metal-binding protein YceD (DUF177 family)
MNARRSGERRNEQPRTRYGGRPAEQPWSAPVAVAEVADTGRHVDLAPDEATREALAKVVGVLALPRLQAAFDLARVAHDGLRVVGLVSATVAQSCVVTLEPVQSEIEETIDLVFLPPAGLPRQASAAVAKAMDADEPPELLQDGMVDLGAVATEYLILGIDPYPRKAGALLETQPADEPAARPFAALAALKKENGAKGR